MSLMTKTREKRENQFVELVRLLIHAAIIALVIRTFLFQPFNIPSGSMKATLLVGDYLFVSKYSYGYSRYSLPFINPSAFTGRILAYSQPERGDVVVFRLPADDSTDYIKRVIGLPGDRIQVINGHLHINGAPVKRTQIADFVGEAPCPMSSINPVKRWRETLPNGVTYETLDCMDHSGFPDTTQVFTVPANHYFMMGDNRDNSTDSRFPAVGFVPLDNLVGKAQIIFFSVREGELAREVWRWPWTVRWDRLLTIVR